MLADKETARFGEYFVMLGEGRASMSFCLSAEKKLVDGRAKPDHDEGRSDKTERVR